MSEPHKLIKAFRHQAVACESLGSPFLTWFCQLAAKHITPETEIGRLLFDWPGDVSAAGASLPLRLHGCLHRLVITGENPDLASIFPPNHENLTDPKSWHIIEQTLSDHQTVILDQLQFAPQTNEVRRSAALLPGFLKIAEMTNDRPFILSELGASAGLNLNWDRYHYQLGGAEWGDPNATVKLAPAWSGPALKSREITVTGREGCDLNPIDLTDGASTNALLSYFWPDQPDRMSRTKAAIEIFHAHPVNLVKMDALDWLRSRLLTRPANHVHVIYHTIAWQYFDEKTKTEGRELIENAGGHATSVTPLAWLSLEADGDASGARLSLTVWPQGETQILGRADFHGRWIDWYG